MRSGRAVLAEIAAAQWGLVTTAQAVAAGVPRVLLSRMASRGELDRIVHGVYATPGADAENLTDLRALWLTLDPDRTAEDRLAVPHESGVLSHATAAGLHGLGDLLDDVVEMTVPARRQTRREGLRIHVGRLAPDDVTIVGGLPVTTVARTVADLVVEGHDLDHVATVMADGITGGRTEIAAVSEMLRRTLGDERGDDVLTELRTAARLDDESIDRALATTVAERGSTALNDQTKALLAGRAALTVFADQQRIIAETMMPLIRQAAAAMPQVDNGLLALAERQAEVLRTMLPSAGTVKVLEAFAEAAAAATPKISLPDLSALTAIRAAQQMSSAGARPDRDSRDHQEQPE